MQLIDGRSMKPFSPPRSVSEAYLVRSCLLCHRLSSVRVRELVAVKVRDREIGAGMRVTIRDRDRIGDRDTVRDLDTDTG